MSRGSALAIFNYHRHTESMWTRTDKSTYTSDAIMATHTQYHTRLRLTLSNAEINNEASRCDKVVRPGGLCIRSPHCLDVMS